MWFKYIKNIGPGQKRTADERKRLTFGKNRPHLYPYAQEVVDISADICVGIPPPAYFI